MQMKMKLPDKYGHFGQFGGKYVPETLMTALNELEREYLKAKSDPKFKKDLDYYLKEYAGRPSPLYFAERLTDKLGGKVKIYLKREDLNHTGAHKINNTIGQGLLTLRLGKKRVIAETGAGQHGVATATAAALFNLKCDVFMGEEDIERQKLNVFRMKLLGADVIPVSSGTKTLKDAMNEAIRDWMATVDNTHYVIGTVSGPHPYPMMVRDFQSVIGIETKKQILKKENRLPDVIVACVGGGSNAMGIFYPFLKDKEVRLIGVEAAGRGIRTGQHASSLGFGEIGVLHGSKQYLLQTEDGQIKPAHSISAGLDYPGVGPELCYLKQIKRATYVSITDKEALEGFELLTKSEGILPALESAHAIAYLRKLIPKMKKGSIVVVNLSGRGDKDIGIIAKVMGTEM